MAALLPATMVAKRGAKEVSTISKKMLGFDFIPLITSLTIFYVIAFVIAKFMEASRLASGAFATISKLAGYHVPSSAELPQNWNRLFTPEGFNGFTFWDIINVIAVLLIVVTALNHQKTVESMGNKVAPTTWAIFGLLAGFIVISGVSGIVMKIQKQRVQWSDR